jgi:hypothetical protein
MAFSAGTEVGRHPQKTKRTRKTKGRGLQPCTAPHSYSATLARSEWRREQQGPPRDEGLQPINLAADAKVDVAGAFGRCKLGEWRCQSDPTLRRPSRSRRGAQQPRASRTIPAQEARPERGPALGERSSNERKGKLEYCSLGDHPYYTATHFNRTRNRNTAHETGILHCPSVLCELRMYRNCGFGFARCGFLLR